MIQFTQSTKLQQLKTFQKVDSNAAQVPNGAPPMGITLYFLQGFKLVIGNRPLAEILSYINEKVAPISKGNYMKTNRPATYASLSKSIIAKKQQKRKKKKDSAEEKQ
jgi:hypothetical protein